MPSFTTSLIWGISVSLFVLPRQVEAWTTRTAPGLLVHRRHLPHTTHDHRDRHRQQVSRPNAERITRMFLSSDESWDDDVDYESEFPEEELADRSPDPALSWNTPKLNDDTPKLGIDIGKMLDPLTEREAAEIKAAATEVINDAIAGGIDDIEKLRAKMKKEVEKKRATMAFASELNAQRESERLLSKIDALTDNFLSSTDSTRSSTKLAATADRAMKGKALEMGTWGDVGDAAVALTSLPGKFSLLGSVATAKTVTDIDADESGSAPPKQSILVVADTQQDVMAKQLLPLLTEQLQSVLPGLEVSVYKPTATLPLGGNDAACVLVFCTSLTDKSSVYSMMDRILRKTLLPGGGLGRPPTQIVAVSTIGTERTDKMPYTMQNLLGGKLDKRRQIEEAVINTVKQRATEPSLDYTICKFGELKQSVPDDFGFAAGDALDGATQAQTAATILLQAIALQPSARNATLSCVGSMPQSNLQEVLDETFLRLEGPELVRFSLPADADANYDQLVEYVREWAFMLADTKGLTTPIQIDAGQRNEALPPGVQKSARVQLLFLPTSTGKNYLSREEEKEREKRGASSKAAAKRAAMEGGIEIVAEVTVASELRVRAKRCNYVDGAVIKELSEETILSRFRKCIEVWKRDHE